MADRGVSCVWVMERREKLIMPQASTAAAPISPVSGSSENNRDPAMEPAHAVSRQLFGAAAVKATAKEGSPSKSLVRARSRPVSSVSTCFAANRRP